MDDLDLKILTILDENARVPYDLVGKRVGLTGNAVRTRTIRMLKDGVIEKFVLKLQPEVFGVQTCYVYFVHPDKLNAAKIINETLGDDDPRFGEILTGVDGSILIKVFGKNTKDIEIAKDYLKELFDIDKFDVTINRYKPPIKEQNVNNSVLKVINFLLEDVRMSVANLARNCKATSKSIKYYLAQIKDNKLGRFSIHTQPYKISQKIFIILYISKANTDYINFSTLFDSLKHDLKSVIFNDYLLVDPPGIFCELITESIAEIDEIEEKVQKFLKDDYLLFKTFPSRCIYRDNLVNKIIRDKITEFNN